MGASNLVLKTALGHSCLSMLSKYTHLQPEITRSFSENISKKILGDTNDK